MLRGLYSAANAMRYREHEIEVVTNNLANVSTDGFKKDRVAFRSFGDLLTSRINDMENNPPQIPPTHNQIGIMNLGGPATETEFIDFSQGAPVTTGNPLDLYLNGPGFFEISTENGIRYTRTGSFYLTDSGVLVTPDGNPVLGTGGQEIRITSQSPIDIDQSGEIRQNNIPQGRISIVEFPDTRVLEKEGFSLYRTVNPNESAPNQALNTSLEQGVLERSNVDIIESLVQLITAQRAYEAAAKAVDMFNESMKSVSGELGRLPA